MQKEKKEITDAEEVLYQCGQANTTSCDRFCTLTTGGTVARLGCQESCMFCVFCLAPKRFPLMRKCQESGLKPKLLPCFLYSHNVKTHSSI